MGGAVPDRGADGVFAVVLGAQHMGGRDGHGDVQVHQVERRQVVEQHGVRGQPVDVRGLGGVDGQIAVGEHDGLRRAGGAAGELEVRHGVGSVLGRGRLGGGVADQFVERRHPRDAVPFVPVGEHDGPQGGQAGPYRLDQRVHRGRDDHRSRPAGREDVFEALLAQQRVEDGADVLRPGEAEVGDGERQVERRGYPHHGVGSAERGAQGCGAAADAHVEGGVGQLPGGAAEREPFGGAGRGAPQEVVDPGAAEEVAERFQRGAGGGAVAGGTGGGAVVRRAGGGAVVSVAIPGGGAHGPVRRSSRSTLRCLTSSFPS